MEKGVKDLFPAEIWPMFSGVLTQVPEISEIRLRAGEAVYAQAREQEYYVAKDGSFGVDRSLAHTLSKGELLRMMEHLTKYSPYAYDTELRQGFLTMPGGHRVGVAGQGIVEGNGQIKGLKYISCMNIRIARQVCDIALPLLPYLYVQSRIENVLIASAPGCGKTTYLRDLIRQIAKGNSYGRGRSVGVVDERMELSAMHMGEPCMNLGGRCDVLSGVGKREGIMMLIRSMNPSVIAVDEIGSEEDMEALKKAYSCGIGLLSTIHAKDLEDLFCKDGFSDMLRGGIFTRLIFLKDESSSYGPKSVWAKSKRGGFECLKEWD